MFPFYIYRCNYFILRKSYFIIFLCLLYGCCKNFDTYIPSSIKGKTLDSSENTISNVKVWIKNNEIITTYSSSIGFYEFTNLEPGEYQIWGWKEEYDTTTYTNINISEGDTIKKDIKLFFRSY